MTTLSDARDLFGIKAEEFRDGFGPSRSESDTAGIFHNYSPLGSGSVPGPSPARPRSSFDIGSRRTRLDTGSLASVAVKHETVSRPWKHSGYDHNKSDLKASSSTILLPPTSTMKRRMKGG